MPLQCFPGVINRKLSNGEWKVFIVFSGIQRRSITSLNQRLFILCTFNKDLKFEDEYI